MGGPGRLRPFMAPYDEYGIIERLSAEDQAMIEPQCDEALRNIGHAPLRDHLRDLCLTSYWAASDGGEYLGSEIPDALDC
jgi:hypothetical protein